MVIDSRCKEICNEYAAQTMFCQSQANSTEKKPFFLFFYFQQKPKVSELQNLASKKPKCQPYYTRIENAHKVRKKSFDFLFCMEVQKA